MSHELLRLAEKGQVTLCLTSSILEELNRVLGYERLQPRLKQLGLLRSELIAYVLNLTTMFEVEVSEAAPLVVVDPDDDIFLDCALAAKAAYVISGDQHVLALGEYQSIPIVTIRDFLSREFPALVID
jgi:putative PIN family toxin of toxin-antitoxin system